MESIVVNERVVAPQDIVISVLEIKAMLNVLLETNAKILAFHEGIDFQIVLQHLQADVSARLESLLEQYPHQSPRSAM
jgi:hypothetical protein